MIRKIFVNIFIGICFLSLQSCSNCCSSDDDFRTIPVTNNPHVIPNTGSPIPGLPTSL